MDTSHEGDEEAVARVTRRIRTFEEKSRIVEEASRPGASVAAVARRHGLNANLVFGWRRLHRRGLLEGQRHAPPLLPVQITSPTLTPTQRASRAVTTARSAVKVPAVTASAATSFVEIILGDERRIRLHGEAQRAVLARVLAWLPER